MWTGMGFVTAKRLRVAPTRALTITTPMPDCQTARASTPCRSWFSANASLETIQVKVQGPVSWLTTGIGMRCLNGFPQTRLRWKSPVPCCFPPDACRPTGRGVNSSSAWCLAMEVWLFLTPLQRVVKAQHRQPPWLEFLLWSKANISLGCLIQDPGTARKSPWPTTRGMKSWNDSSESSSHGMRWPVPLCSTCG